MSDTIKLAQQLIREESVTPEDGNCQSILVERLSAQGFTHQHLKFGDVRNLWSVTESDGPLLVFAGHTDVVPPGPLEAWQHPPFAGIVEDGWLHGRGAADMKSSIAAMVVAVERASARHTLNGRLGFLITSDEEGPAINGTTKVVDYLNANNTSIDWCVVGEPTSNKSIGDTIKNGRRGSMNGNLTVIGKQGHVAYPHLANNPVHLISAALQELTTHTWDNGNEFFPPTTFQVSNIHAGTGVENVVPGEINIRFNFRFSTEVTTAQLQQIVTDMLDRHQLNYKLDWRISGQPFITARGDLVNATLQAIADVCGTTSSLSTSGGTSDGRFIAPTGAQVIELGPCNATIHQVNERVTCEELERLTDIYEQIIVRLLS